MAKIRITLSQRFEGDFALAAEAGAAVAAEEKSYVDRINELLSELAEQETSDDADLQRQLNNHRKVFAKNLETMAVTIAATDRDADRLLLCAEARDKSFEYFGIYLDRCDLVRSSPFSINPIEEASMIHDIDIRVLDVEIPTDKRNFKVELDRAIAIVRAVLLERISQNKKSASEEAKRRLHEYLRALVGIARVGLVNSNSTQVELGVLALKGFKDDFVTREAGFVKNSYVFWLGYWAALALIISVGLFFLVQQVPESIGDRHRNFFLLFGGASIGTWLSFSLRRVVLSFSDLASLEEDRLKPQYRVAFMIALTFVIGLLFFTSAVQITLGGFKTDMGQAPSALLIGALCGIAERAMASAVAKRADDFAAGVGGSTKGS